MQVNEYFSSINSDFNFSKNDIKKLQEKQSNEIKGFSDLKNIPIPYYYFKSTENSNDTVLWVGGIHADEFAALYSSLKIILDLINEQSQKIEKNILFIPLLNVDGLLEGFNKRGYAYRENGKLVDLNRAFYAFNELPNYKSTSEIEFVINLIKKYQPTYWVIPHASLHILDFDGLYDTVSKNWLEDIYQATVDGGGRPIPIKRFGNYSPPNSKTNWSIGKLAAHLKNIRSLTFEFPGPGEYPSPDTPNRNYIILKRKQLGRFEDSAWYAEKYFTDYESALKKSLFIVD